MRKKELREKFKNHCIHFTLDNNVKVLSKKVMNHLSVLDWSQVQRAALYHPLKGEVIPCSLKKDQAQISWHYPADDYCFLEESSSQPCPPENIDVFLVPGVAFDHDCRRLGRGGGFYDRVLSQSPKSLKIGVGWSVQWNDRFLPEEDHDIRMDLCVNENFLLCSSDFFNKRCSI